MKKSQKSDASAIFRRFFAVLYPIFVSIVLIALSAYLFNLLQTYKVRNSKKLWQEKANLLLASIKSNHNFYHVIRTTGNSFVESIERNYPASLNQNNFNIIFNRQFSPEIKNKISQRWAFYVKNNKTGIMDIKGFDNTHKWVMKKVFKTLVNFSDNKDIAYSEIQSGQKFLKNIFGPWCAPLILARSREGTATPIVFAGKNQFIYWRKIKINDKVVAGIILLIPEEVFRDKEAIMRMIASRFFARSKRRTAVAFVPCEQFRSVKEPIMPDNFYRNKNIRQKFLQLLKKVKQIDNRSEKQMQFIKNHVFLREMFSEDSVYDAVVFSRVPEKFQPKKFPYIRALIFIIIIWTGIFIFMRIRYRKTALPLKFSFRIIFFLTGLLPICFMLITGFQLIEANYQSKIIELKLNNTEKLSAIDAKSHSMLPLFSWHLSRMLKRPEIQKSLINNSIDQLQDLFELFNKELGSKNLDLNFMYAYEPDKTGKLYLSENIKRQYAEILFDIMSSSIYAYINLLNELHNIDPIKLTPGQKNWYNSLKGVGRHFLPTLFSDSIEHEIMLAMGENQKRYFYSTIIQKQGKLEKILTFTANLQAMFRHYLTHQLNSINIDNSSIFLAAQRHKNSEYTIFPFKKMKVLNSRTGKNAFNFLKNCRGSLFPEFLTGRDFLYIYYPLTKMKDYTIGCAVSLSEPNLDKAKKQLILSTIAGLLMCIVYVLGSFATSYLIKPLQKIEKALNRIAEGKLNQNIELNRKDEIGMLAQTVNLMQKGFKERLNLGKFVSGTLDKSISSIDDTDKLLKPSFIKGTILFSDIRKFTTISEGNPPEKISSMLNMHLDQMSAEIHKYHGQVEQFVGDAIIAFFPDKTCGGNSKTAALHAALQMNQTHKTILKQREKAGQFLYNIGIGLKYGTVIAGTLISASRSEFAILGQAKSEAENLEALSKKGKHSKIIVTSEFFPLDIENCSLIELEDEKDVYEVVQP